MESLSRRSILRLSSYITGGLVLPLSGAKALTLLHPEQAENVAVAQASIPISEALKKFRALAKAYVETRYKAWDDYMNGRTTFRNEQEVADGIVYPARQRLEDQGKLIISRPVKSWADVRELAEVAWLAAPKDDCPVGPRSGDLKRGTWRRSPTNEREFYLEDVLSFSATAALIDAVLEMTGGERISTEWEAHPVRKGQG